jgi:hypothetical protein
MNQKRCTKATSISAGRVVDEKNGKPGLSETAKYIAAPKDTE